MVTVRISRCPVVYVSHGEASRGNFNPGNNWHHGNSPTVKASHPDAHNAITRATNKDAKAKSNIKRAFAMQARIHDIVETVEEAVPLPFPFKDPAGKETQDNWWGMIQQFHDSTPEERNDLANWLGGVIASESKYIRDQGKSLSNVPKVTLQDPPANLEKFFGSNDGVDGSPLARIAINYIKINGTRDLEQGQDIGYEFTQAIKQIGDNFSKYNTPQNPGPKKK